MIQLDKFTTSDCPKLVVKNGKVEIDGQLVAYINAPDGKVLIELDGNVASIQCDGSVSCADVLGDIRAGGSVNCDDVGGDVTASGSVSCDDVEGNVKSGGSVVADSISGTISAGGSVRIG